MEELPKHPDVAAIFTRLLSDLKLNARQFAQRLGITPQAVSNYMQGRNEPNRKMIGLILKEYPHINAAYLATGEGEPFPTGVFNQKPAKIDAAPSTETKNPGEMEPATSAADNETEGPEPSGPASLGGVARQMWPTLRTPAEEIAFWREQHRREVEAHERTRQAHERDRDRSHEREIELIKSVGGRKTSASPDAADPQPANMTVSWVNPEKQAAKDFLRRRPAFPVLGTWEPRPVVTGFAVGGR